MIKSDYPLYNVCAKFKISPALLRKYENYGIVGSPLEKRKGKKRFYSDYDLQRIAKVKSLLRCGLSLSEIGKLAQLERRIFELVRTSADKGVTKGKGTVDFFHKFFLMQDVVQAKISESALTKAQWVELNRAVNIYEQKLTELISRYDEILSSLNVVKKQNERTRESFFGWK